MKREEGGGESVARSWLGNRPGTGQEPDGVLFPISFVTIVCGDLYMFVCAREERAECERIEWVLFDQEHFASKMKCDEVE